MPTCGQALRATNEPISQVGTFWGQSRHRQEDLVVVVTNRCIPFSKLSRWKGNLGESHAVALSPTRRTPEGVIDAIGDWMQWRDAEFGRISTMCADPGLPHGLAADLRTAVGPGWLDR